MRTFIFISLAIFSGWSCGYQRTFTQEKLDNLYNASIADAAFPAEEEISNSLISLTSGNPDLQTNEINGERYILAVTWVGNPTPFKPSEVLNTKGYETWVTIVPEMARTIIDQKAYKLKSPEVRIRQLLGLPPDAAKSHFVEMWVRPDDLYRPCPDPEVTDVSCQRCFPADVTAEHRQWIDEKRLTSYVNCKDPNGSVYPWTQLGYTYDWHPKTKDHFGLSEFVIRFNSNVHIHRVVSNTDYFAELKRNAK